MDRPLTVPFDTTFKSAYIQIQALRDLGSTGRLERGIRLSNNMRALLEAGVRHRHPNYDDDEVRLAVIRILLGRELFKQCYPDKSIRP